MSMPSDVCDDLHQEWGSESRLHRLWRHMFTSGVIRLKNGNCVVLHLG